MVQERAHSRRTCMSLLCPQLESLGRRFAACTQPIQGAVQGSNTVCTPCLAPRPLEIGFLYSHAKKIAGHSKVTV